MKKIILLSLVFVLSGCDGENEDGSSINTYSSCKIIDSQALLASDQENDLNQCWNASGNGYESQSDAMQWCEEEISNYMVNRYLIGHTVKYSVQSTYCN